MYRGQKGSKVDMWAAIQETENLYGLKKYFNMKACMPLEGLQISPPSGQIKLQYHLFNKIS